MQDETINEAVTAPKQDETKQKVVWGIEGYQHPTPLAAKWFFRVFYFANKAVMFFISGTDFVPVMDVKTWVFGISALDIAVWGIAQGFGIKKSDYETL